MSNSHLSNILLDTSPKKINRISEDVLDTLFTVNEFIRELNSFDFCNPLGYIITKTLPPGGIVDNLLKEYSKKIISFNNKVIKSLELNNNNDIVDNIEEIRLSLEEIIPTRDVIDVIPGGDSIVKTIQNLNDSLVISNTLISTNDKVILIKSFSNRLLPLTNPINLTELLLSNQVNELNKKLTKFINPKQFKPYLLKLINLVIKIDKSISQIQSIIILVNKIIKTINILIKVFKTTSSILQKTPIPAKFVTVGMTVTASTKVSKLENDINDFQKILKSISQYLSNNIILEIKKIRNEIFILLIGLNQLYENLSQCDYFNNNVILDEIQKGINSLNSNINILEELFPSILERNEEKYLLYKGYNINIVEEIPTDNNTNIIRRRVIITNNNNIIEYEGKPTYSTNIQLLKKEGEFYIDSKNEFNTTDINNNITDEENEKILEDIGLDSYNIEQATSKENEINTILKQQINNNPEDKKLYNNPIFNQTSSENKIIQVSKIVESLKKLYTNPILIQNRIEKMKYSLLQQGYTLDEIQKGIKLVKK